MICCRTLQTIATAFPDLPIEGSAAYDLPALIGTPNGVSNRIAFAAFSVFDQTSSGLPGEPIDIDHGARRPVRRVVRQPTKKCRESPSR